MSEIDLEMVGEALQTAEDFVREMDVAEVASKPKRVRRVRSTSSIPNKDRKIESIVLWLESGMDLDDIKDNLSTWIDDEKLVELLIEEAVAEQSKPKAPEEAIKELYERISALERATIDMRGSIGAISDAVSEIKDFFSNKG